MTLWTACPWETNISVLCQLLLVTECSRVAVLSRKGLLPAQHRCSCHGNSYGFRQSNILFSVGKRSLFYKGQQAEIAISEDRLSPVEAIAFHSKGANLADGLDTAHHYWQFSSWAISRERPCLFLDVVRPDLSRIVRQQWERQKQQHDGHAKARNFSEGDSVFVHNFIPPHPIQLGCLDRF